MYILARYCTSKDKHQDIAWTSVTNHKEIPIGRNPIPSVELPHNINYAYENCIEIETTEEIKEPLAPMADPCTTLPDLLMPAKASFVDTNRMKETDTRETKNVLDENSDGKVLEQAEERAQRAESILEYFDNMLQNEDSTSCTGKSSSQLPSNSSNNSSIKSFKSEKEKLSPRLKRKSSTKSTRSEKKELSQCSSKHSSTKSFNLKNKEIVNADNAHSSLEVLPSPCLIVEGPEDKPISISTHSNVQNDESKSNKDDKETANNVKSNIYTKQTAEADPIKEETELFSEPSKSGFISVRNSNFAQKLDKILGESVGNSRAERSPTIRSPLQERSNTLQNPKRNNHDNYNYNTIKSTNQESSVIPTPPKMPTSDILRRMHSTPANLNKMRISVIPLFDNLEEINKINKTNLKLELNEVNNPNINKANLRPVSAGPRNEKLQTRPASLNQLKSPTKSGYKNTLVTVEPYSSPDTLTQLTSFNIETDQTSTPMSPEDGDGDDNKSVLSRAELREKLNSILSSRLPKLELREGIVITSEHEA